MWNSRKTENLKQFFAHEKSLQASKASNDRVKDTLRCWIETNLRHYRCKYSMMTGDYVRASIRLHNGSINLLNISRSTPFAIVATVLTFVPTIFIPCRAYFSCAQNILFKTKTFFSSHIFLHALWISFRLLLLLFPAIYYQSGWRSTWEYVRTCVDSVSISSIYSMQ